jgi:preprotein translocase subunit YajC
MGVVVMRPSLHCKVKVEPLASADLKRRPKRLPQTIGFKPMPAGASPQDFLIQFAPILLLLVLFYFMLIRPQQKRAKEHMATLAGIKRNDTVVLSNGMIGKIVRVEDKEVGVEIAQGVTVKVIRAMVSEVRSKGDVAPANDSKN